MVKDDGVLTWLGYPQDYSEVTIADLKRTFEDGLFDGDVRAVILDRPTLGNGGVVVAWSHLVEWLVKVGAIYGGIAAVRDVVKGLRNRLEVGTEDDISSEAAWLAEFVERHRAEWEAKGAKTPIEFLAVLLSTREWDSARLRRLLQIDIQEAAKFLEVCGYEYNAQTKIHQLTPESKADHLPGAAPRGVLGVRPPPHGRKTSARRNHDQ